VLVQGIGLRALNYNPEDYDQFRFEMDAIDLRMEEARSEAELMLQIGAILKLFDHFDRKTEAQIRLRNAELLGIIGSLTTALAESVAASDTSLHRLGELQTRLSGADKIEDLRALKNELDDCLKQVAIDVQAHRKKSVSGVVGLDQLTAGLASRPAYETEPPRGADSVTGLPTRAEAVHAIEMAAGQADAFAVAFCVQRLPQINARFGYEIGDEVLEHCATYLGSGINPEDGLYRWQGPGLVAVIRNRGPMIKVLKEVRRLVGKELPHEVNLGNRSVMLPVAISWAVLRITTAVSQVVEQVDAFLITQNHEDVSAARQPDRSPDRTLAG
jgi:GGDEF domain-containing protein